MAGRSVISYDDITLPPAASSIQPPASKKRKWNNNPTSTVQHWDDPTPSIHGGGPSNKQTKAKDKEVVFDDDEAGREDGESRELTHEEIWDDSALVDAWNAAMEEYEAYNGPDKGWKKEPVHKSPLWYNVPPKKKPSKPRMEPATPMSLNEASVSVEETDSKPINFETFVPTHDPSISDDPALEPPSISYIPTEGSVLACEAGTMISQDEAFSRALSAMYWGGYWTAMYHCQRQLSGNVIASTVTAGGNDQANVDDEDMVYEEEEEEEEFVSTQR